MKKFLLLTAIAMLAAVFLISGCHKQGDKGQEAAPLLHCPLDNAVIEEMPIRAVVVTIDNAPKARPQSGLMDADLLYELPAEGGISRYVAVFYHGSSDKIGPVRSARPYLVDIAKEWSAVYVHVGGSNDALSYLSTGSTPYINEFSFGSYFWRDNARKAPHNLYTSSEKLWQAIEKEGWAGREKITAWPFLADGDTQLAVMQAKADAEGNTAAMPLTDAIKIDYAAAKNTYRYDAATGLYLREIGGQPQLDAESGQQLAVANVLVQFVSSKFLDDAGRLSIDMVGEGEAWLFSGGAVQKGYWSRDSVNSRTVFYDDDGHEWKLASGKTWIQVVDQTVNISYTDSNGVI